LAEVEGEKRVSKKDMSRAAQAIPRFCASLAVMRLVNQLDAANLLQAISTASKQMR
jgi:hypothetical protein